MAQESEKKRLQAPIFAGVLALMLGLSGRGARDRAIFLLVLVVPGLLLNAAVFHSMWNWFVAPIFLRPITYVEAIGFTIMLAFVRGGSRIRRPNEPEEGFPTLVRRALVGFSALAMIWGAAWLFHLAFPLAV